MLSFWFIHKRFDYAQSSELIRYSVDRMWSDTNNEIYDIWNELDVGGLALPWFRPLTHIATNRHTHLRMYVHLPVRQAVIDQTFVRNQLSCTPHSFRIVHPSFCFHILRECLHAWFVSHTDSNMILDICSICWTLWKSVRHKRSTDIEENECAALRSSVSLDSSRVWIVWMNG